MKVYAYIYGFSYRSKRPVLTVAVQVTENGHDSELPNPKMDGLLVLARRSAEFKLMSLFCIKECVFKIPEIL